MRRKLLAQRILAFRFGDPSNATKPETLTRASTALYSLTWDRIYKTSAAQAIEAQARRDRRAAGAALSPAPPAQLLEPEQNATIEFILSSLQVRILGFAKSRAQQAKISTALGNTRDARKTINKELRGLASVSKQGIFSLQEEVEKTIKLIADERNLTKLKTLKPIRLLPPLPPTEAVAAAAPAQAAASVSSTDSHDNSGTDSEGHLPYEEGAPASCEADSDAPHQPDRVRDAPIFGRPFSFNLLALSSDTSDAPAPEPTTTPQHTPALDGPTPHAATAPAANMPDEDPAPCTPGRPAANGSRSQSPAAGRQPPPPPPPSSPPPWFASPSRHRPNGTPFRLAGQATEMDIVASPTGGHTPGHTPTHGSRSQPSPAGHPPPPLTPPPPMPQPWYASPSRHRSTLSQSQLAAEAEVRDTTEQMESGTAAGNESAAAAPDDVAEAAAVALPAAKRGRRSKKGGKRSSLTHHQRERAAATRA